MDNLTPTPLPYPSNLTDARALALQHVTLRGYDYAAEACVRWGWAAVAADDTHGLLAIHATHRWVREAQRRAAS